jgi:hypothetical protein
MLRRLMLVMAVCGTLALPAIADCRADCIGQYYGCTTAWDAWNIYVCQPAAMANYNQRIADCMWCGILNPNCDVSTCETSPRCSWVRI